MLADVYRRIISFFYFNELYIRYKSIEPILFRCRMPLGELQMYEIQTLNDSLRIYIVIRGMEDTEQTPARFDDTLSGLWFRTEDGRTAEFFFGATGLLYAPVDDLAVPVL